MARPVVSTLLPLSLFAYGEDGGAMSLSDSRWYTVTGFQGREAFTDGYMICVGMAPGETYGEKSAEKIIHLIPKYPHPAFVWRRT